MDSASDLTYWIDATRYSNAAACTVVVFDWIICLSQEQEYIHPSRWSFVKFMYLFARYYPLVFVPVYIWIFNTDHSYETCLRVLHAGPILAIPTQLSAEIILVLRIYAFSRRKRWVLIFLVLCLVGLVTYQLWDALDNFLAAPFPSTVQTECFPTDRTSAKQISGFFLSSLCFDTIATTVFILHAFYLNEIPGVGASKLQMSFIRDGLGYFLMISAVNFINSMFFFIAPSDVSSIIAGMSIFLPVVIACRLILSLRSEFGYVHPTEISDMGGQSYGNASGPISFGFKRRAIAPATDEFGMRTVDIEFTRESDLDLN